LTGDGRDFVPTAELVDALDVEPTEFARQMSELGCRPCRDRVAVDGRIRQVRGYRVANLHVAVAAIRAGTMDEDSL
jgi:DNA segregation ATPase FtsK/SpoIIIE, S-DNA-T family